MIITERPQQTDKKYKLSNDFECVKIAFNLYDKDRTLYIDQLEAENKKLKQASSILNSLSNKKPCPACENKMVYKPRLYHCYHCKLDFN